MTAHDYETRGCRLMGNSEHNNHNTDLGGEQ